ncbi:MAG: hypothetical protein H7A25_05425 [Leptospiraceae bacterium]|nr:hypothetical protein [Leptospiraceae bacterium]MCP5499321.1 hypothetical protein [Leptospiraceae bacterium]
MKNLLFLFILFIFGACKDDPNPKGDFMKNVILESGILGVRIPVNNVEITSIEPQRVYPAITTDQYLFPTSESVRASTRQSSSGGLNFSGLATIPTYFTASVILIKGKNFEPIAENNTVKINTLSAEIVNDYGNKLSSTEIQENYELIQKWTSKDLLVKVPTGAYSGLLYVLKPDGDCGAFRSGFFCAAEDIYIDCYKPYKNQFGEENLLEASKGYEITYENLVDTKAFRVELPLEEVLYINIACATIFSVKQFGDSCQTSANDTLVYKPSSILINRSSRRPNTFQFFLTAGKGTCNITVSDQKLFD